MRGAAQMDDISYDLMLDELMMVFHDKATSEM